VTRFHCTCLFASTTATRPSLIADGGSHSFAGSVSDRFSDDNPQDAVGGTSAPSVARRYSRRAYTGQLNHTAVLSPTLFNDARVAYLYGDPVTLWEAHDLSTAYTRAGNVPFADATGNTTN